MNQALNLTLFNIDILVLTPDIAARMKEVKSTSIFEPNSQVFNTNGLFSTDIFGPVGSSLRNEVPSYINLKVGVLHPLVFQHIISLKGLYGEIFSGKSKAKFDTVSKDFVLADGNDKDADTGYTFFLKHMNKIEFKDTDSNQRYYKLNLIKQYANTAYLLDKYLVLPAGIRDYNVDASGKTSEDEINNIYRKLLTTVSLLNNTVIDESNLKLMDPTRYKIQLILVEIYEYIKTLLDGKNKFIQGKWAKRAIMHGTRNVITPNPINITNLKAPNKISFNQTVIGTFQYVKSILPITMNKLHTKFIRRIFSNDSDTVDLFNPKTMRAELVTVPTKIRDEWLSTEGLNNIINKLSQDILKTEPIKVNGYYLMLVYDDGKNVSIIMNNEEITSDMKEEFLRPITYIELMYLAVYETMGKYPAFLTRYPVAGLGGIYPTFLYVKTTIIGRTVNVTFEGETSVVYEYPRLDHEFVNSVSPHPTHLARLGAD